MVLFNCERQGLLEPWATFGWSAEPDQRLAEQDTRHHPIVFLGNAENEVFEGIGRPILSEQGLRETEAKQLVFRVPVHQRDEVIGSVSHGSKTRKRRDCLAVLSGPGVYSKNRATPVELSSPPRSLARSIKVVTTASGLDDSFITLAISSAGTKRVMPSLQSR